MNKGRTLADVRADIDGIDDAIQDLLIRRTALVEEVRSIKSDWRVKIQPSREASIIYRLMDQHHGALPRRDLIAMWRILICATLSFEGPFSVAVFMPADEPGYWDLARDHFGPCTLMTRHGSFRSVIEAVHRQDSIVGVLPMPRRDDEDPWWRHILTNDPDAPKVIARLPFAGVGNARGAGLDALVICPVEVVPTGRDRSFIAADCDTRVGLAHFGDALRQAGLEATFTTEWREEQAPPAWLQLAEVEGCLAANDPRLETLRRVLGKPVQRLLRLGGYATPLSPESLDAPPVRPHGNEDATAQ